MNTAGKKYLSIVIKSIAVFISIVFLIAILLYGKPKFHTVFLYIFTYSLIFSCFYKRGKKNKYKTTGYC